MEEQKRLLSTGQGRYPVLHSERLPPRVRQDQERVPTIHGNAWWPWESSQGGIMSDVFKLMGFQDRQMCLPFTS